MISSARPPAGCPCSKKRWPTISPAILAVDAWGESASYVAPYVRQAGLPGTVLIDPPHRVFDSLYQGQGTPTSFYIDAQGVIRQEVIGPRGYSDIIANARLIGA